MVSETLNKIYANALKRMESFNIKPMLPALRKCPESVIDDVLNTNGIAYYQFLPNLIDEIQPKQVVELGGAMGVADIMMLNASYQDFELYSITLPEHGLEFLYVADTYPNFHPIIGDDLDMKNWEGVDLAKTDLWFFDSEHTEKQIMAELELYSDYFKKGSILLFDDIRMGELYPTWVSLPYKKLEITNPCHYSGFGMAIV